MKYAIVFACLIVTIVFYIVFGHNGILKNIELVSIRKEYEERNREMDKKIEDMERELELTKKKSEFLENVIRRELGLQKEGEDVFIILDNETKKEDEESKN